MIRTFKKKDLLYLKRILIQKEQPLSEKKRKAVLGICRYLSDDDYRDMAPHETKKVLINK